MSDIKSVDNIRVVAIIPARLASSRFPNKVLYPFFDIPMLEHVRRRTILSGIADDVYVATCDKKIQEIIQGYGGKVIMTSDEHENGTSRIAEACRQIECTHVILVQGDEPLLLPYHLHLMKRAISNSPETEAWNITGPIEYSEELDRHSFVKCAVNGNGEIMYCFRKTPAFASFETQQHYIRKMLGLISYRKEFLLKFTELSHGIIEMSESIEQMRIIEHRYSLRSIPVEESLPSVNEPAEVQIVMDFLDRDNEQKYLLDRILKESTSFIQ
jgi:3-deoxy-manno-octulosonate cytidylyltransferase (CMP-KDO synthetase)